jgi:hypothetical protein
MDTDNIARVSYFDRQFLRTRDFVDEQAYQIAMRRRHNIAHHRWGIVEGLQIREEEGDLFVEPGMAIDGYGRELILPERQLISIDAFAHIGSNVLDVWLAYNLIGSDPAPKGFTSCHGSNAVPNYRWQETPSIQLTKPESSTSKTYHPEVEQDNRPDFSPIQNPPDDPRSGWPVFLGRLTKSPQNQIAIDQSSRLYVGLVGESIQAPSGITRIDLGTENKTYPFAVFFDTRTADQETSQPKLAIDKAGNTEIRGDATIFGNLAISGGAIEFRVGQATGTDELRKRNDKAKDINEDIPENEMPAPWQIYRATGDEGGKQLRIEMEKSVPPDDSVNQIAFGFWSEEEKKFISCLTIDDSGNVSVLGNLIVQRYVDELEEPKKRITLDPDEETKRFLVASSFTALGGVPGLIPLINKVKATYSPEVAQTLFVNLRDTLKSDQEQFKAFLRVLVDDKTTADLIRKMLK